MRFVASTLALVMMTFGVLAQCEQTQAQSAAKTILPAAPAVKGASAAQYELVSTAEELSFLANGPRLYTMQKALELQKATGKPIVCWMGPHLFSADEARELSGNSVLTRGTIQAAMDSDGEEGKIDPRTGKRIPTYRLKVSTGNYANDTETVYVPLSRFAEPGIAEKVLAKARGGR